MFCLPRNAFAQTEIPQDLVNAVNALRASLGLEPYTVDPGLMAYAQEHAEYLAAMDSGTHRHSDGTLPGDLGLQENVAGGDAGLVTVAVVVHEIWVDVGHRHVLTGYPGGEIGAGIALSGNGQVYYTVDIRPGGSAAINLTMTPEAGLPDPLAPQETSVLVQDGFIIHIVRNGESLWGIAVSYGVSIAEIRHLNNIPDDSTLIYPEQKLLIRPAPPATPTPTQPSELAPAEQDTGSASLSTESMSPAETVWGFYSGTVTPANIPASEAMSDENGPRYVVLVICVLGILVCTILRFWKY